MVDWPGCHSGRSSLCSLPLCLPRLRARRLLAVHCPGSPAGGLSRPDVCHPEGTGRQRAIARMGNQLRKATLQVEKCGECPSIRQTLACFTPSLCNHTNNTNVPSLMPLVRSQSPAHQDMNCSGRVTVGRRGWTDSPYGGLVRATWQQPTPRSPECCCRTASRTLLRTVSAIIERAPC